MESKKTEDNSTNPSSDDRSIKTTAVDTGRRIDVGHLKKPGSFVRRRSKIASSEPAYAKVEKQEPEESLNFEEPKKEEALPVVKAEAKIEETPKIPEKRVPLYVEPLEFDESGDFASMLSESEQEASQIALKVGDRVTGKIVHIGKENIFLITRAKKLRPLSQQRN